MVETEMQLKRIQTKLQQLLKKHAILQKENGWLRQETLDNLKQQIDVLKYSGGEMSETDKKEFEKKINSYVKEIDRCIVMLSQ